jgi:putative endonuclease
MYYVYVIESEKLSHLYIGQTQEVEKRITRHNAGTEKATRGGAPWKLIGFVTLNSRSEAMALEKKLKGFKSRFRVLDYLDRSVAMRAPSPSH